MIFLLRAFIIFILESPLQTWDKMQPPSHEPEQWKHCLVCGIWMVDVWKGKSCSSFQRNGHMNTGMIVLKTKRSMILVCSPFTLPAVILALEAVSLLANGVKTLPLFVRQHMLWLKINSETAVTVLGCCPSVCAAISEKCTVSSCWQGSQQEQHFPGQ